MQVTLLHGYPDRVGRRAIFVGSGKGPTSYTGGAGATDVVSGLPFQFYVDTIVDVSISLSGTYYGVGQPSSVGPRATWAIRYFVTATGAEVTAATNLSAETFVVSGFGGFS